MTYLLKDWILQREDMTVARERPVNTLPWQGIQERSTRGIVEGRVFYVVRAEAI